jgi:aryl-alcohol dehydrogenase-like predicted oxidoreductase
MEINGVRTIKEMLSVKTLYCDRFHACRLKDRGATKEEIEWRLSNSEQEELTVSYTDLADAHMWNGDEVPFHETMRNLKEILQQWQYRGFAPV